MMLILLSFLAFFSSLSMLCLHDKMITLCGKVYLNVNAMQLKIAKKSQF